MTAWHDRLGQATHRLAPGWGNLWRWWRASLLAWLPARWQLQLGVSRTRLLLSLHDAQLRLTRQTGTDYQPVAELPWPQNPQAVASALGPQLAALPQYWVLPSNAVLQRSLRLPAAAAERLRDVVGFEIDRQTPFQADQVYFDARSLARHDDGQLDVALVVVPKRSVEALLDQMGEWRAQLAGIDVADAQGLPLDMNLLPVAQRQQRPDPMRRWNLLLGAVAVLATAAAGWQLLDNRQRAADTLRAEVDAHAREARVVAAQRQQLQDLLDAAAFFDSERAAKPTVVEVWDELSRRLPEGTYLEKLSIEGNQLQLIGLSREASSLVTRLEGAPMWRKPSLTGVLQSESGGRRDRFTLTAELQTPPTPPTTRTEAAHGAAAPSP